MELVLDLFTTVIDWLGSNEKTAPSQAPHRFDGTHPLVN
jgi:hypothetical protein